MAAWDRSLSRHGGAEHRAQHDGRRVRPDRRAPGGAGALQGADLGGVDIQVDRHVGAPPDASAIEKQLRAEARDVYGWSNGPGDRYEQHTHTYHKLLYCTQGSIDFVLEGGRTLTLRPGDRMVLPAGTPHGARVGPEGCVCVEGKV